MDINTETLATLPDMSFSSILVPDVKMAPVAVQATQISTAAEWHVPPTGDNPDTGHPVVFDDGKTHAFQHSPFLQ